jgi:AcrR family transcriptional regulator
VTIPDRNARPALGRDGAATRAKIEREALRLFARRGVDATSVRDIALAVGVADAALYRHFRSKDDIARAIFADHYGALARAIHAIAANADPFPLKIERLVALFCRLFDETPDVFAFILINQHAHLRFVPDNEANNAVVALRQMMMQAHSRGETPLEDPDLAAAMALGAVTQPGVFKLYGRLPGPLTARLVPLTKAALRVLCVAH